MARTRWLIDLFGSFDLLASFDDALELEWDPGDGTDVGRRRREAPATDHGLRLTERACG